MAAVRWSKMAMHRRALVLLATAAIILAVMLVLLLVPEAKVNIQFRPSSVNWTTVSQAHPVTSMQALPTGQPLSLPPVQYGFPRRRINATTVSRQTAVRNAFLRCWNSYTHYAQGYDELLPSTAGWTNSLGGWGVTLVDSLDTLFIMGLTKEFDSAAAIVAQIDWANTTYDSINVFETTIRYLGGILGAYDLSGETALLQKATELGDMLYMAFDTPNRIPPYWLDFEAARNGTQLAGDADPLSAPTSLCLEFTRLAQLTGDAKFYDAIDRVTQFLLRTQKQTSLPGIWPQHIDFQHENVTIDDSYSLGALSDSIYEYFPKMYALLGGLDAKYETLYRDASDAAVKHLLFRPMVPDQADIVFSGTATTEPSGITLDPQGQHLACFAGGMFALGGKLFNITSHVDIGNRIARGCAWAYQVQATGIMPESFNLIPCGLDQPCAWNETTWLQLGGHGLPLGFASMNDARYLLRPEAIESIFLLYRMTGDEDLQDIAWDMFQSIMNATETSYANSAIANVTVSGVTAKLNSMEVSRRDHPSRCSMLTTSNRVSGWPKH
jgi:mannosyl-oligosaccharide alpha-1,2-mannosidase